MILCRFAMLLGEYISFKVFPQIQELISNLMYTKIHHNCPNISHEMPVQLPRFRLYPHTYTYTNYPPHTNLNFSRKFSLSTSPTMETMWAPIKAHQNLTNMCKILIIHNF